MVGNYLGGSFLRVQHSILFTDAFYTSMVTLFLLNV